MQNRRAGPGLGVAATLEEAVESDDEEEESVSPEPSKKRRRASRPMKGWQSSRSEATTAAFIVSRGLKGCGVPTASAMGVHRVLHVAV